MKIVINGLCTVLFIAIVGCVSGGRSHMQSSPADEETTQQLEQALEDLANENYTSAAHILEQLIKEKPVSEFDLVILYNSAVAREGLKNCEVAAERYRSVARIANKRFDRVAALALYRLGFAYDCLGDSQKSVVAFLDARKASKSLPPDVATAELPARLAAGYASLGRQKEALHYFDEASGGLKRLLSRAKGGSADKKLAASTMYAMGRLSETNDPVTFARMLSMQQPFLLQSAELAAGPSSSRAKSDLKEAYHRLIQQKLKDPKQEREFYIEGLKAARQLQRLKLPNSKDLDDVFRLVEKTESTLQNRLANTSSTIQKTPQEEKRQSLKKTPQKEGR